MRVWAFPSFYPYTYPGMQYAGIFAHRQYKALLDHGADLKVIVPVLWSPPFPFYYLNTNWKEIALYDYPLERNYDGIKVYHPRISNMKPSKIFRKPYIERYVEAVTGFFKKNEIKLDSATDIFYSQWLPDAGLVQMAAHKLGVKSAVLGIGDDVVKFPNKDKKSFDLIDKTLSEADLRFAVAQYVVDAANKLLNKKLPFHIVRRGVNYDFFAPVTEQYKEQLRGKLNLPSNKMIILTVGLPIIAKGWIDLLDALAVVKKYNNEFVLHAIYSGHAELDIGQEAINRGLEHNFIHVSDVQPDNMSQYYNAADIFCLPAHAEGIANVVTEAMSCGLPVITTSVGGHPELITNDENGILIEPKSVNLLSQKLQELLLNEDYRRKLGGSARQHIVNNWGSFAENSKKLYDILKSGIK